MKDVRSAILKSIEQLREQGIIKHSLEARVTVCFDEDKLGGVDELVKQLNKQSLQDFFKEFLIVSQFEKQDNKDRLEPTLVEGLYVLVQPAQGNKCPRCWQWQETNHPDNLCPRCVTIFIK